MDDSQRLAASPGRQSGRGRTGPRRVLAAPRRWCQLPVFDALLGQAVLLADTAHAREAAGP
ncbi:hypothetical protein [Streptomyces sp. ISL-86]|uniref:hypothetical protein n=1 Tax=Streptomyces sp. ISL-86 TaxID=2819187 RepID=UPI001BE9BEA5|nr:hypothetical protein [Streptomyces sp. ISL-86]MBT2458323.1 hypothetical protein [Streptomyces sp. ISL-86]